MYYYQHTNSYILSQNSFSEYGKDWQGSVPDQCTIVIEVPETNCPLEDQALQNLFAQVPLQDISIRNAVNVFIQTTEVVNGNLSEQNNS